MELFVMPGLVFVGEWRRLWWPESSSSGVRVATMAQRYLAALDYADYNARQILRKHAKVSLQIYKTSKDCIIIGESSWKRCESPLKNEKLSRLWPRKKDSNSHLYKFVSNTANLAIVIVWLHTNITILLIES